MRIQKRTVLFVVCTQAFQYLCLTVAFQRCLEITSWKKQEIFV